MLGGEIGPWIRNLNPANLDVSTISGGSSARNRSENFSQTAQPLRIIFLLSSSSAASYPPRQKAALGKRRRELFWWARTIQKKMMSSYATGHIIDLPHKASCLGDRGTSSTNRLPAVTTSSANLRQ